MRRFAIAILAVALVTAVVPPAVATAATAAPSMYANPSNWLCRPDVGNDACDTNLDATVVNADGTTHVEHFTPAKNPRVDCFYVYPTISADPGANSDLVAGPEEKGVARLQFARLASQCRLFAPMYRQGTLNALLGRVARGTTAVTGTAAMDIAYADVVDAWNYYLAHDNHRRGVVLIGHSQGSRHLDQLIKDHIDNNPTVRSRITAAYLLGWGVNVPAGKDVGGDFSHVSLCRKPTQLGCVVAYSTFRSTAPPPPTSFFGRSLTGGSAVACVDPAALAGGSSDLHNYFASTARAWKQPAAHPAITTPFVSFPGLLRAQCVAKNGFTYLELTVVPDASGPRTDDIGGDLTPQWGLHLVDVNIALGDIISLVHTQAKAYLAHHKS